jgi:hypothetical protein
MKAEHFDVAVDVDVDVVQSLVLNTNCKSFTGKKFLI